MRQLTLSTVIAYLHAIRHYPLFSFTTVKLAMTTCIRRLRKASDYSRWSKLSSLSRDWDSRTAQIACLIAKSSSVLEFGAGRMILREFLPEACQYTPSDLVDRGQGTFVCDLNVPKLPSFPKHDVAVFSAVLEYVNDVPRLISHLCRVVDVVIASYAVTDWNVSVVTRRAAGWVNDYSSREFENIFLKCGFHPDKIITWQSQKIYRFVKTYSSLAPTNNR